MTKKFRILGLVQDRLSPVFVTCEAYSFVCILPLLIPTTTAFDHRFIGPLKVHKSF